VTNGGTNSLHQPRRVLADAAFAKLETSEETPMPLPTAGFEHLQIVTTVIDNPKGLVRVRVMTNAKRAGPGRVSGDLLTRSSSRLVGPPTTKLPQNLTIRVIRISMRRTQCEHFGGVTYNKNPDSSLY
jgi:hypothetical protein